MRPFQIKILDCRGKKVLAAKMVFVVGQVSGIGLDGLAAWDRVK